MKYVMILFLLYLPIFSDSVELKNGTRFEKVSTEIDDKSVTIIKEDGEKIQFPLEEIKTIVPKDKIESVPASVESPPEKNNDPIIKVLDKKSEKENIPPKEENHFYRNLILGLIPGASGLYFSNNYGLGIFLGLGEIFFWGRTLQFNPPTVHLNERPGYLLFLSEVERRYPRAAAIVYLSTEDLVVNPVRSSTDGIKITKYYFINEDEFESRKHFFMIGAIGFTLLDTVLSLTLSSTTKPKEIKKGLGLSFRPRFDHGGDFSLIYRF